MKRPVLALVFLAGVSPIGCASSEPSSDAEKVGRVSAATIDDRRADGVFGQPDPSTGTEPVVVTELTARRPAGLAWGNIGGEPGVLTVADRGNHRVRTLVGTTLLPWASAFHLGQPSFDVGESNQGGGASYATLSGPTAVAQSNDSRYAVADTDNHRVLVGYYYSTPSYVLGQHLNFNTATRNSGGLSNQSMAEPKGVAWATAPGSSFGSPPRLLIADSGNHRLLVYTDPSFGAATWELGQHDESGGADVFDKGDPNDGKATPDGTTLRDPRGLATELPTSAQFGGVWVADTGNHRVLHFSECSGLEAPIRPCRTADFVIGQKDMFTADPSAGGVTAFSLEAPSAVARDNWGGLWIADTGHNRVLHFKRGSTKADRVIGQPDFETAAPPTSISDHTLSAPTGVAVDPLGNLYVADTGAHRILRYAFIATPESCDDGDPCTDDSVKSGICVNSTLPQSKECFPYMCDLTRRACVEPCTLPGSFGVTGCQPRYTCTSTGQCKKQCFSPSDACPDGGQCVDGWCCDALCSGTCEACNVPGSEGTCSPVFGPPANTPFGPTKRVCARAGLDDPECAGQCDGRHRAACVPASVTATCGPETCNDGVATLRGTCDGYGRCTFVTQACAPYACAPNGCRVDCTAPHHCAAGADCVDGRCVGASDQKIGGVGCALLEGDEHDDHGRAWATALAALAVFGLARRRRGLR